MESANNIQLSPEGMEKILEDEFDPEAYLETYYSDKPHTVATEDKVLKSLGEIRNRLRNNGVIDIKEIIEIAKLKPEETLDFEDIVIFDFHRNIAIMLLEAYPEDNIEVLDVGGGPTIYQHMIISLATGNITHSDFLEKNINTVGKWLNGDQSSFNWDAYFALAMKVLKNDGVFTKIIDDQLNSNNVAISSHAKKIKKIIDSLTIDEFKEHLRQSIGGKTVQGNVFSPNLGLEDDKKEDDKRFDVVTHNRPRGVELLTSNFGLEAATNDPERWKKGLENIVDKIKLGGFLAMTVIRNAKGYNVGNNQLPATNVNEDVVKETLITYGCKVIDCQVLKGLDKEKFGYDGTIMVFAQKIKENNINTSN